MAAGLFESRARAQEAVAAGLVQVDGRQAAKPSERVRASARLEAAPPHPWVSRGGIKLAAALDLFDLDPNGQVCLDVGASTGGFTEVLLSRGARHVYAVDVGHGQLHPRLRSDARVNDLAGTDIRNLGPTQLEPPPNFVVCDASFISLTLVLPTVSALAAPRAAAALLVKPQFEVGRAGVRKGLVRSDDLRQAACDRVVTLLESLGWRVSGIAPSPITGRDGNVEFLLGASRP